MPMSQLYMFDRKQDYGYARTEPVQVVASRHHLRIWKSPYEVNGQPLWVGACTHDIGFERDQRNNGVTHKIDPEIDKERDYLAGTLNASGLVSESTYVTPPEPITEAHTEVAPLIPQSHGAKEGVLVAAIFIPNGNGIPIRNPIGIRIPIATNMRTGEVED